MSRRAVTWHLAWLRQFLGQGVGVQYRRPRFGVGGGGLAIRYTVGKGDNERRVGMAQLVGHLILPVVGIDRHDRYPQRIERQVVVEKLRPVLEQQSDSVTVTVTRRFVTRLHGQDRGQNLVVGKLSAVGMVVPTLIGRNAEEGGVGRTVCRRREGLKNSRKIVVGRHANLPTHLSGVTV